MASTKNNFLNAKPVSKMGGKSGGVRKPSKPYAKPPAKPKAEKPARWDAKTKTERLQEAAKTKPKSPAPRQVATKPVTRTGPVKGPVPPKGSTPVKLPNSSRAGTNLPKVGARAERTAARVADLKKGSAAKPSASKPASTAPKPAAKPAAAKPNPYTSGKPNPSAAVRGVKGGGVGALGLAGRALVPLAMIGEVGAMVDRQKRWDAAKEKMKKPVNKDANGRSSTGVRVSDKQNNRDYQAAPTGSQRYNDYRNQQIAAERERLKGVGNSPKAPKPPAPKPQASRPAGTQPSRPAASRPTAPAKPASPAASKDRRVSASTANRESGNYGTSRTNNPMIDDAMKGRMRQREDAAGVGPVKDGARYAADMKSNTQGVGPVKDGSRYASNVKDSPTTAGKKKEDETKTMSIAERMRRRRAGLA